MIVILRIHNKSKESCRNWESPPVSLGVGGGSIIGFLGSAFRTVEGVGGGCIFVPMLTLVVVFIFVIMRLVLLAIYGLEYLDNFIQTLGISYNFLNEVIHANQSILFIYNHNSYNH